MLYQIINSSSCGNNHNKGATLKLISLLLLSFFLLISNSSYASHAAGGELIYQNIDSNRYLVTFKFYRDCSGIEERDSVELCVRNTCLSTSNYSIYLDKIDTLPDGRANGSQVAIGCSSYQNKCDNPSSPLPGYREWWYQDTIELYSECKEWILSTIISARNKSENIIGSGNLYVEAKINNYDVKSNNSAIFYTKPVPYVCFNKPFTYNNGAVDPDNDSLSFEVIIPLASGHCSFQPSPLKLANINPPLNSVTNPFQTNNTYNLDPVTGNISFIAGQLGSHTTAILVKEYRDGILVGSTIRDIQVQVLNCINTPTVTRHTDTANIKNGKYFNGTIEVCAGELLEFCFNVNASDSDAIVVVSDNKNIIVPKAQLNYQNNKADTIIGCFSWQTAIADTGLKTLTITAKDSTCRPPGISISQVFTIPIRVIHPKPPVVVSPVEICYLDSSVSLTAYGSNLNWYRTSNSTTPYPTPPTPDYTRGGKQYFYVTQTISFCESKKSVIEAAVLPLPEIDLAVSKDTICAFEEVQIWDQGLSGINGNGYTWSMGTGVATSALPDKQVSAYWEVYGSKRVSVELSDGKCSIFDTAEVYVDSLPFTAFNIPEHTCINVPVQLVPKAEKGTYSWLIEEQQINDTVFVPSYDLAWTTGGNKEVIMTITSRHGCVNSIAHSIEVHDEFPLAEISIPEQKICLGEELRLTSIEAPGYIYNWGPSDKITRSEYEDAAIIAETGYIHIEVNNEWNCTSRDTIFIDPPSCCLVTVPDAFTPNGDGLNDICRPITQIGYQIEDFKIANRFGELIYQSNDRESGWNGKYKGVAADIGTYYYFIKYKCNDGIRGFEKGTVLLIR